MSFKNRDGLCCDKYLSDFPLELGSFRDGFKKDPIEVQGSETILQPKTAKQKGVCTTTETADSPLSNNFKPIQKYLGSLSCSCECRNSIFKTCGQTEPIPIRLITHPLINLSKIGEGAFGEVYTGKFSSNVRPRIYKIVAIEGKKLVNDQKQRKFKEIEPEIIVCQQLSKLSTGYNGCYTDGFVNLHNARICQGKYPKKLMDAWRNFKQHAGCENTKPDYPDNQFYAVFEHDFCGTNVCAYHFKDHRQSLSIILQVAHALAAAEVACEFEHRDLHWGNVLIQETLNTYNVYTITDKIYRVPCCGLTSTIIDFSNSRLTADGKQTVFYDLANDEEQFIEGPDKVQFEVYKRMKRMTRNKWDKFTPKSNVMWIQYLTTKFLEDVSYTHMGSDCHHEFTKDLRKFRSGLMKYKSCADCVKKYFPYFVTRLEENKSEN